MFLIFLIPLLISREQFISQQIIIKQFIYTKFFYWCKIASGGAEQLDTGLNEYFG